MDRPLVYIAGPLTTGSEMENIARALTFGMTLLERGYTPFVPHLTFFWQLTDGCGMGYEDWMDYDFNVLRHCEALFRMSGASAGADREVTYAQEHDIPVFIDEDEMDDYFILNTCYEIER